MTSREELVEARKQVVASDYTNADVFSGARAFSDGTYGVGTVGRVHTAGIRNDTYAAFGNCRENALDRPDEVTRVPKLRVALLLLLKDRHSHFGEVVEHQVVDLSSLHLAPRRLEPVPPKALAGGDPNELLAAHTSSR